VSAEVEERDWRLEVWGPLQVGAIMRVRHKCAGRWSGAIVRVVERHDDHLRGTARYTVEAFPPYCPDAIYHGYDPAMQHDGSRFDVCRYELSKAVPAKVRAMVRTYDRRSPEHRTQDRRDMPFLVDAMRTEER
jgi:hypothetical protein